MVPLNAAFPGILLQDLVTSGPPCYGAVLHTDPTLPPFRPDYVSLCLPPVSQPDLCLICALGQRHWEAIPQPLGSVCRSGFLIGKSRCTDGQSASLLLVTPSAKPDLISGFEIWSHAEEAGWNDTFTRKEGCRSLEESFLAVGSHMSEVDG